MVVEVHAAVVRREGMEEMSERVIGGVVAVVRWTKEYIRGEERSGRRAC